MRNRVLGILAGLFFFGASGAMAQVVWDSPLLVPPRVSGGVGIFLIDPAGGDLGVMGTWRSGNLGLRVGLAEDVRDDLSIFGGVDFTGLITRASNDFPLDVAWVAGAGIGIGDDALLSFPLGISLGRGFDADGARFTPYATPRVVLDAFFGDDSDLDLDLAVDFGLDIAFQPGWMIRFGATIGDRDALAIGVVF